jgi:hypothetical protein
MRRVRTGCTRRPKLAMCHSKKKAKYFGLHFHDLRRTGHNSWIIGKPSLTGLWNGSPSSTRDPTRCRRIRGTLTFCQCRVHKPAACGLLRSSVIDSTSHSSSSHGTHSEAQGCHKF